jgi:hypothetical protein
MEDCCAFSIQDEIWRGYGEAAEILGSDYKFFRPGNPPIPTGNFDTPGRALDSGKKLDRTFEQFDTTATFDSDKILDQAVDPDLIDQTNLDAAGATLDDDVSFDQPGNYLFTRKVSLNAEDMRYGRPNKYGKPTWYALVDGTDLAVGFYFQGPQGTFFIATMQALLPILVVSCNRVVNIFRPYSQTGITGRAPYGGNTDKNSKLLVAGRPCSILQGTKGEKGDAQLPGDVRSPWWTVLIPQADTDIRMDDIIKDDRGVRYVVSSSELTDMGFRLTCMQAAP